jgi:hypothetical protein
VHVEKGSTGALPRLLLGVMTVMGRGEGGRRGNDVGSGVIVAGQRRLLWDERWLTMREKNATASADPQPRAVVAARLGLLVLAGSVTIGRRLKAPSSMQLGRGRNAIWSIVLPGCCIGRVPGDADNGARVGNAGCTATFTRRAWTAVVAFSPSTRGSIAAVTHGLHMSAALPHVKQVV